MRLRHSLTTILVAALCASTGVVSASTSSAATTDVVVRPGALHGWGVEFLTASVRPGFVTGPATPPLGEGSFRFDTGAPGAAAAGAKVELSNGSLNDQPVATLTGLRFDVYLDENDTGTEGQPYLNFKVDADDNGSIDTTLSYAHTAIPLNTWTAVDTQDGSATGASGWFCLNSTVVSCGPAGMTWAQVLTLLPDEAVFQNSLGFPRSLIFSAGHTGSAAGETVRGAVDRLTWSVGDAVVRNDFEPAEISAADNTGAEPGAGGLVAQIDVSLSGPNGFRSLDAPLAGRRGQPVTVNYATADGTATAGEDYTPATGTITFDPADPVATRSVGITVLADAVVDDGETVLLHLSAPVNGVLVRATATLTITQTAPTAPVDVVVRPGALHGWGVEFLTASVRPGFVTGPATPPLGEGSFRFDTGAPGAAAAGAKVELSNGSLNDQPVATLTGLRFDVYLDENDTGTEGQPYLNFKVDADDNGSIDTTLSYAHTAIPLNTWTAVDTQDGSATGASGWFCLNSTVVSCGPAGMTWAQVLTLLPDEAVFQNSLGFPRSLIFSAGHTGSAAGETVRGAVDRLTWSVGDAVVRNDFEPAEISAADNTVDEPTTGTATGQIEVTLSGRNSFFSLDAPLAGRRGQPVTVNYATADGTATAGEDYVPSTGTLTYDPATGATSAMVPVTILADTAADDGETVLVTLSAPVNGVLQRATGTLTINDTTPPAKEPGYVPLSPVRLLDTRNGTGAPAGFAAAGSTTEVHVAGMGGVAATAKAVALNVTVTQPKSSGFVTAYPCGQSRPTASNLNYTSGLTIPNLVVLALPASGKVCLYTSAETHLVADVDGYFSKDSDFEPMSPRRLVDTRSAVNPAIKVPAGSTLQVQTTARYGIPDDAAAVSLNVTAVDPSGSGYLTTFPCGTTRPTASTLNYVKGQVIPNAVLSKTGSGGNVCIYTLAAVHLVVDVNGWFPSGTDFRSMSPERLLDTRSGLGHSPAGLLTDGQVVELQVIDVGSSNIPDERGCSGAQRDRHPGTEVRLRHGVPVRRGAAHCQQSQLPQGRHHRQRRHLEGGGGRQGVLVHAELDASRRRRQRLVPSHLRAASAREPCQGKGGRRRSGEDLTEAVDVAADVRVCGEGHHRWSKERTTTVRPIRK